MKSQIHKNSPVRISFLTLKVSTTGVMIPSMVPNMLPSPRFTSMRKNITDQKGENQSSLPQSSPQKLSANSAGISLEDGGKEHNSKTL